MASSETRETIENGNVDVTEIENGFKKDKARTKSNFTRSQNRLILLSEEQDTYSRISVIEAREKLESCLEIVLDILEHVSDFYTRQKERKKCKRIVGEMLRIEENFEAASISTRDVLESRKVKAINSSSAEMQKGLRFGITAARITQGNHFTRI